MRIELSAHKTIFVEVGPGQVFAMATTFAETHYHSVRGLSCDWNLPWRRNDSLSNVRPQTI